jgi:hypothetical protein
VENAKVKGHQMSALPDGWELGPDGVPRRVRKRFRLSDMTIDEVSVVERGANQRAHIVLAKGDDMSQAKPDPYGSPAVRYADAKEIYKHYQANPDEYDRQYASKGDAGGSEKELENILGLHQFLMAELREAALGNSTRSLFQRLMSPEFAEAYDAIYGQPE